MAFWEDATSSRTPSLHCKMKWYRFRTAQIKATPPPPRYITCRIKRRRDSQEIAAPPDQPARARIRDGAPPTCRQRQYVDRGR
eukprot:3967617-Prymnesium_polylepis.1